MTIMFLTISANANIYGKVEGKYCKLGPATDTSRVFICEKLPKGMLTTDIYLYLHDFAIPNDWSEAGNSYEIEVLVKAEIYYNPNASKPFSTIYTNWGIRNYTKQNPWGGLMWPYPLGFNLELRNVPLHGKVNISISMIEYDLGNNDIILLDTESSYGNLDLDIYPTKGVYKGIYPKNKKFIKFGEKKRVSGKKSNCLNDDCINGRIDFTVTKKMDKHFLCKEYASNAVVQYQEAHRYNCGFNPPVWSGNKQNHYKWCMRGENSHYITPTSYQRDIELQKCKSKYGKKMKICEKYKTTSLAQYREAKQLQCPFNFNTGTWSGNKDEHFKWCIHGDNYKSAHDAIKQREQKLRDCKKNRSPGLLNGGQSVGAISGNKASIEKKCRTYALDAVRLNQEAQKHHCGFRPPVWGNDHQKHFDWCMHGENHKYAVNENRKRKAALQACKSKQSQKNPVPPAQSAAQYCKIYAQDAINQYSTSRQRHCGYEGLGWSLDYNAHYNWCISVYKKGDFAAIANETARRNAMLANCK